MSQVFPSCRDAIVAAVTTAKQRRVVHERDHIPVRRYVTVGTFTHGLNMAGRL